MESIFWLVYITVMTSCTAVLIVSLISTLIQEGLEIKFYDAMLLILCCTMWADFIVYFKINFKIPTILFIFV